MSKTFPDKGFIDDGLYRNIVKSVPITCVDLIIVHENKFLLGKRLNKPLKNRWCLCGGRILKGEPIIQAIYRKLKDETGLNKKDVENINFLTVMDVCYPDSEFDSSMHNINLIHKIQIKSPDNLTSDNQHSNLKWFSKIDKEWPLYIRQALKLAGFK